MAGGTLNFATNKTLMGRIVWSSVSNGTAANSSAVTCSLQVKKTDNTTEATTGTWSGTLTIGSKTQSYSIYKAIGNATWITVCTDTVTISHGSNGAGSCYIYGKITGPTETTLSGVSVNGSDTVSLDTIPRFASISSAPNFNDEENPTITYSNPAGSSVTLLRACISLDGQTDDITYRDIEPTKTSYTFSLTDAERDLLRSATTGSNSRTVRFFVRSGIGSEYQNSSLPRTFSIKDPKPTISPTVTDSNDATFKLTGNRSKLVKYYSNAAVTIGATAVKKAELVSTSVTCGTKRLSGNGTINAVESKSFVFTATDNRGNTENQPYDAPFVDYVKLTCNVGENKPSTSGTMTLKVTGNCFAGSFGAVSNTLTVKYKYKAAGGTYPNDWTTMTVTPSGTSYTATASLSGLDYKTAYTFQAYAEDKLATVYSSEKTVISLPVFDWGANDFAFNVPVHDKFGTQMGNGLAAYAGGGDSGIDPDTTLEELVLTSHTHAPQGLGTFYYIHTAFYNTKSTTAARAQLAFPYKKTGSIYHRYYADGAWSAWAAYALSSQVAPAGYGLGGNSTNAPTNNDANQAIYNGWFSAYASTANAPKVDGSLLVESRSWGQTYQTIKQHGTGCVLQRCQKSGVWGEWEWVNPPMVLGVEYRTTERWQSKYVYTKLVDLGTLPNATSKTVNHGASATRLLCVSGVTSTGTSIPYRSGDSIGTIAANTTQIVVYYSYNASSATGTAQIWYTKD